MQGVAVIPAMIGLFSFSQVLVLIASRRDYIAAFAPQKGTFTRVFKKLWYDCKRVLLVSSGIGTLVGMLPGAGGEIASIIAYNEAKRWDKQPERFGTGVIEGVAASESSNNAVIGGALIPMLTLGIPGSAVAAVILGALLAKGIQPGFKIFTDTGELAYTFMMSQVAANIMLIPIGYMLAKIIARLLNIKLTLVSITIVVLSVIGSYAINNSMLDVWMVMLFGLVGFFGGRIGLDSGSMALGIILGPMIEENLGKCLDLSRATGSLSSVFLSSNTVILLISLTILSCLTPWILARRRAKSACQQTDGSQPLLAAFTEPSPQNCPRADLYAALCFIVAAGVFFVEGRHMEGPGSIFPLGLQVFLAGGGLILLLRAARHKFVAFKDDFRASLPRVCVMLIATLVYISLINVFGFFSMSFLFMALTAGYFGDKAKSPLTRFGVGLLAAAIVCTSVWACFVLLLQVPTPEGLLW